MKNKNICKVKKCDREVHVKFQGLCYAHYQRFVRTGFVDADKPIREKVVHRAWDPNMEK